MKDASPLFESRPELIGRREEMEKLESFFDDTEEGYGSTVFISGEAGIGKTRLVEEFLKNIDEKDAKIIKGDCIKQSLEPLLPIKEAFRDVGLRHLVADEPPPKVVSTYLVDETGLLISKSEREESDLDADIFASMLESVKNFVKDSLSGMGKSFDDSAGLNTIGFDEYNILIQQGDRFSLAAIIEGSKKESLITDIDEKLGEAENDLSSWDGDMSEAEKVEQYVSWFTDTAKYKGTYLADDPAIKQENLFENVLLGLKRQAEEEPVILFLDDLQWADSSTLSLIHYLSRNTQDSRILIIGTYRPEDIKNKGDEAPHRLETTLQNMGRESLYTSVNLKRLHREEVENFLERYLGPTEFGQDFLEKMYSQSEGNPLFLLELLELLIQEDHIEQEGDGWSVSSSLEDVQIPTKIYEIVTRRLNRLNESQTDILECASIIGEEFESKVVSEALDMPKMNVLKLLDKVEKHYSLIRSTGGGYRFDHSQIREVLYGNMGDELKREFHHVIGESLEKVYEEEEVLSDIAHHYYRAEDPRAPDFLLRAAEKAKESYANQEAISLYKKVISMDLESEESLKAREGLADVYSITGEYDESIENYHLVIEEEERPSLYRKIGIVFKKRGDYDEAQEFIGRGLSITEEEETERCRLLGQKGMVSMRRSDYDKAIQTFKEERDLAERLGDREDKASALHHLGTIHLKMGDLDEAETYLNEAVKVREQIEDMKGLGGSLGNLGALYIYKGELDEALDYQKRSLEINEDMGDKTSMAGSLHNMGNIYLNKGKLEKALEFYERSLEIREEIGDKLGIAGSLNNIANLHLDKGDLKSALEYHQRSLDMSENIGDDEGIANSYCNMGVVHQYRGELDEALDYHQKSLKIRKGIGDKQSIANSLNKLGNLHLFKGDLKSATESLRESLDLAREIGKNSLVSLNLVRLTGVWVKREDLEKAERRAEEAMEIAKDLGLRWEEGMCHMVYGILYREKKKWENSLEEFEKAIEILSETGDREELARANYEYGLMWKRKGEDKKAKDRLEEALSMFEDMGMELWIDKAKGQIK